MNSPKKQMPSEVNFCGKYPQDVVDCKEAVKDPGITEVREELKRKLINFERYINYSRPNAESLLGLFTTTNDFIIKAGDVLSPDEFESYQKQFAQLSAEVLKLILTSR